MHTKRQYHLIGACSCWGAQIRACEKGPEALAEGAIFERLIQQGFPIQHVEMLYPSHRASNEVVPQEELLPLIQQFNIHLAHTVRKALAHHAFPIILGGDHSIAVGTWNAFTPPFGLLWIDAHMDSHTPKTTPSGAYHGMPLAALLGHGAPEMAQLLHKEAVLQPQNIALIGVRSFEEGEAALLQKLNVRIYFIEEVRQRGLHTIFPESIAHITQNVDRYGISLDLDSFSPEEVPGVGSPEAEGFKTTELLPLLATCGLDERLIGFELVEFNPERDVSHKTREVIFEILQKVMQPWSK